MQTILLIGGGGHCRSCIDVIEAEGTYHVAGVVEREGSGVNSVLGYPVLGVDEQIPELLKDHSRVLVTVGQIKSPDLRVHLYNSLKDKGATFPTIVSPHSYVSGHATLEEGTVTMHGAIINASATVGRNCIVNSRALIEHDAVIESHCHVSTGAIVNGRAFVGAKTFVGSGAVIHEDVRVGEKCVIAAGSVVRENLKSGTLFKGGP